MAEADVKHPVYRVRQAFTIPRGKHYVLPVQSSDKHPRETPQVQADRHTIISKNMICLMPLGTQYPYMKPRGELSDASFVLDSPSLFLGLKNMNQGSDQLYLVLAVEQRHH